MKKKKRYTSSPSPRGNVGVSYESQDKADAQAAAMDAANCTDCTNCTGCKGCTSCKDCRWCTGCKSCTGCNSCFNCTNCTVCTCCNSCEGCEGCISRKRTAANAAPHKKEPEVSKTGKLRTLVELDPRSLPPVLLDYVRNTYKHSVTTGQKRSPAWTAAVESKDVNYPGPNIGTIVYFRLSKKYCVRYDTKYNRFRPTAAAVDASLKTRTKFEMRFL